jgi:hypothetical protein
MKVHTRRRRCVQQKLCVLSIVVHPVDVLIMNKVNVCAFVSMTSVSFFRQFVSLGAGTDKGTDFIFTELITVSPAEALVSIDTRAGIISNLISFRAIT